MPRPNGANVAIWQEFLIYSEVQSVKSREKDQKPRRNDYQPLMPETRGKLLMVTDEERAVLRLVLSKVMETPSGREYIVQALGEPYLKIAEDLLKEMEQD